MYKNKHINIVYILSCCLLLPVLCLPSYTQGQDVVAKDVMALDLEKQAFSDLVAMLQLLSKKEKTPENGEALISLYREVAKRHAQASQKSYVISGIVVDDADQPLQDVKITCSKYEEHLIFGEPPKPETFAVVADKTFRIETGRTYRIHLEFTKDGYYSEERYFNAPSPDNLMRQLDAGLPIEVPAVVINDARIVLVKKGTYATLVRRDEKLHYSLRGTASILRMMPQSEYPSIEIIKDVTDEKLYSTFGLVVIAEPDNGVILSEPRMLPDPYKQQVLLPTKAKAIVTDPGGGLIHFVPDGSARPVWLQMKQAPEDGYMTEMQLDADLLATCPYFYIKIGNLYGRFRIIPENVAENKSFQYRVLIQIQPNGTTNLEARRFW